MIDFDSYFDKTKNAWANRDSFVKQPGKFFPVEIEVNESDEEKDDGKMEEDDASDNNNNNKKGREAEKLDARVGDLMKLIFDQDMILNTMKEESIDVKKMPLGKILE